jgi:hypothetical protein
MNDVSLEELTLQIKQLTLETAALKRDLAAFRENAAMPERGAAGGGAPDSAARPFAPSRGVGVVILAVFVAAAVCIGVVWAATANMLRSSVATLESNAAQAARQAIRQQMHGMKSVVQFGKFTPKNRVAGEALAFDWVLKTPINPERVVSVTPELIGPAPPVAVSAEITNGGKTCRMTISGDTSAVLEKLANGLDAKVTIVMDVDQLGALQQK